MKPLVRKICLFAIISLLAIPSLFSEDKPTDTREAPSAPAGDSKSLAEFLRPAQFSIGLSPNLQGQLDGQLNYQLRWNETFSSSIRGRYFGSSFEENSENEESVYQSKTFAKNYDASLTLLEYLWTTPLGETRGLGLSLSLQASYMGSMESASGYKTAQGETTYFNREKTRHEILPALFLSFLIGKEDIIRSEISGTYLPFVLILENGTKLYSTYDQEVSYSLNNSCQAIRGMVNLTTFSLPIGNFDITGDVLWMFGNYGTRQDIINGNYLTTIMTYSNYQKMQIRGQLQYRMDYLHLGEKASPALLLGTTISWETFGTITGTPVQNIQIGMSLSS